MKRQRKGPDSRGKVKDADETLGLCEKRDKQHICAIAILGDGHSQSFLQSEQETCEAQST